MFYSVDLAVWAWWLFFIGHQNGDPGAVWCGGYSLLVSLLNAYPAPITSSHCSWENSRNNLSEGLLCFLSGRGHGALGLHPVETQLLLVAP
jgi:hypothetical protein